MRAAWVGPWKARLWGPVKWHLADRREPFGAQKVEIYYIHIVRLPTSLLCIERDPRSRMEIGERDTQLVHVCEATAV